MVAPLQRGPGHTCTRSPDGWPCERYTRCVAFRKSSGFAWWMFANVCGLRSTSGNQRALHLHHDAVAAPEGVEDVGQRELDRRRLARRRTARASRSCCGTCRGTARRAPAAGSRPCCSAASGSGSGSRRSRRGRRRSASRPSRSRCPVVETCRLGRERPGERQVLLERLASGRRARRAGARRSAGRRPCTRGVIADRDRRSMNGTGLRRVAHVLVEGLAVARAAARSASRPLGVEVERLRLRRPCGGQASSARQWLRAGLEDVRLRAASASPLPFRWCSKNGSSICLAVEARRSWRRTRRRRGGRPSPRAQPPWGHGPITSVLAAPRVLLLDRAVGLERAEEVLGVEPAADGHHGRA